MAQVNESFTRGVTEYTAALTSHVGAVRQNGINHQKDSQKEAQPAAVAAVANQVQLSVHVRVCSDSQ